MTAMIRDCDVFDSGSPDYTEDVLADEWNLPRLDLSRDTRLVLDDRGRPVAYAWVYDRDAHRRLIGFGLVHPDHRGRGIGTGLVRFRERRAAEHADLASPDHPVVLHSDVAASDRSAHTLLERHGYREVRHFWEMVVDLEDAPPAPSWPEGIQVRGFARGQDDRSVHAALQEAFADHWGSVSTPFEEWAAMRLESSTYQPELWFLAEEGRDVAGALLGNVSEGEGWVATLGVRRPWRGRGVGQALLLHAFGAFVARGIRRVKLSVDAESPTGATRLYERVGMRVFRQYDFFEKTIREALRVRGPTEEMLDAR